MTRFEQKICGFMNQAIADQIFPGAVLLISKDEDIVFHQSFGRANIETGKKMRPDSIFDLASLTKPLATTLAVAKLMERHPDLVESPLSRIIEAYGGSDKSQITVDMLLRHTSGLPAHEKYYLKMTQRGEAAKKIQDELLERQKLENPVGSCEVYSDLGFMILRQVVEYLSGQRLDRYVKDEIYDPMAIKRLFFIPQDREQEIHDKYGSLLVATQKCPWRKRLLVGEVDDENAWAVGGVDGHAGLFGDALGVYRLCALILKLLNGENQSFIKTAVFGGFVEKRNGFERVAGFDTPSKEASSSGKYFSNRSIGHLGFTGTSFWIDPESAFIIILLTNRIHPSRSSEGIRKFRPRIHDLIREQLG